jgi:hypothetical protein
MALLLGGTLLDMLLVPDVSLAVQGFVKYVVIPVSPDLSTHV